VTRYTLGDTKRARGRSKTLSEEPRRAPAGCLLSIVRIGCSDGLYVEQLRQTTIATAGYRKCVENQEAFTRFSQLTLAINLLSPAPAVVPGRSASTRAITRRRHRQAGSISRFAICKKHRDAVEDWGKFEPALSIRSQGDPPPDHRLNHHIRAHVVVIASSNRRRVLTVSAAAALVEQS